MISQEVFDRFQSNLVGRCRPSLWNLSCHYVAQDCWTDRPLHGNYLPMHGAPPFEIRLTKMDPKADPDTYSPGEMINGGWNCFFQALGSFLCDEESGWLVTVKSG